MLLINMRYILYDYFNVLLNVV